LVTPEKRADRNAGVIHPSINGRTGVLQSDESSVAKERVRIQLSDLVEKQTLVWLFIRRPFGTDPIVKLASRRQRHDIHAVQSDAAHPDRFWLGDAVTATQAGPFRNFRVRATIRLAI